MISNLHVLFEVKTVGDSGFMNDRIALVSHSSSLVCTRLSFVFDSSSLVCTHLSFVFTRLSFVCTCLATVILVITFAKGKPKIIYYRCFKNFDQKKFNDELKKRISIDLDLQFSIETFLEIFQCSLNRFTPYKQKKYGITTILS